MKRLKAFTKHVPSELLPPQHCRAPQCPQMTPNVPLDHPKGARGGLRWGSGPQKEHGSRSVQAPFAAGSLSRETRVCDHAWAGQPAAGTGPGGKGASIALPIPHKLPNCPRDPRKANGGQTNIPAPTGKRLLRQEGWTR